MSKRERSKSTSSAAKVYAALHSLKNTAPMLRWRLGDYGSGLSREDMREAECIHAAPGSTVTLPSGITLTQEEGYRLRARIRGMWIVHNASRTGRTAGQRRYAAEIMRLGWG